MAIASRKSSVERGELSLCLTAYAMAGPYLVRQTLTQRVRGAERQNDKDGKMTCDVTIQVEGPLPNMR